MLTKINWKLRDLIRQSLDVFRLQMRRKKQAWFVCTFTVLKNELGIGIEVSILDAAGKADFSLQLS